MSGSTDNEPPKKDAYIMSRDVAASARLNYMHYVWQSSFSSALHPTIKESLANRGAVDIADIGTGTGVWLADVSREVDSASRLVGLDNSLAQVPPKGWGPPNCTFELMDVFEELDPALLGRFDVVHVRHFISVVKDDTFSVVLDRLISMLKPGGWLQWSEWDNLPKLALASPDLPHENVVKIDAFFRGMGKDVIQASWIQALDSELKKASMTEVALESREVAPSHLPMLSEVFALSLREVMGAMRASGKLGAERLAQLEEWREAAEKENKAGVAWQMNKIMVIGRKPLT